MNFDKSYVGKCIKIVSVYGWWLSCVVHHGQPHPRPSEGRDMWEIQLNRRTPHTWRNHFVQTPSLSPFLRFPHWSTEWEPINVVTSTGTHWPCQLRSTDVVGVNELTSDVVYWDNIWPPTLTVSGYRTIPKSLFYYHFGQDVENDWFSLLFHVLRLNEIVECRPSVGTGLVPPQPLGLSWPRKHTEKNRETLVLKKKNHDESVHIPLTTVSYTYRRHCFTITSGRMSKMIDFLWYCFMCRDWMRSLSVVLLYPTRSSITTRVFLKVFVYYSLFIRKE